MAFGDDQSDLPSRSDSGYGYQHEFENPIVPPMAMAPIRYAGQRPERPPRPLTLDTDRGTHVDDGPPTNTGTIGLAISELNGNSTAGKHYSSQASLHNGSDMSSAPTQNYADRKSYATTIEEEPDSATSEDDSWGARSTDRIIAADANAAVSSADKSKPTLLVTSSEGRQNSWHTGTTATSVATTNSYSASSDGDSGNYPAPLTLSKQSLVLDASKLGNEKSLYRKSKGPLDLSEFPAPPPIPASNLQRSNTTASSFYGSEALYSPTQQSLMPPMPAAPGKQSYGQNLNPYARHSTDSVDTVTTMESTIAPRTSRALSPVRESTSTSGTDVFGFPREEEPVDVENLDLTKPLKAAEIAALRAMRLRQQQTGEVGRTLHHQVSNSALGSGVAFDAGKKKKPSDLRVDTLLGGSGAPKIKEERREKEKKGLAELTPTRRGEELFLSVQ